MAAAGRKAGGADGLVSSSLPGPRPRCVGTAATGQAHGRGPPPPNSLWLVGNWKGEMKMSLQKLILNLQIITISQVVVKEKLIKSLT